MATISSKSNIDVLLSMKPSEFEALTRRELAPIVSRLNDIARKRIKRVEALGEYSPSVDYINRTGGIEKIRGKDLTDLRNQYLRVRRFLQSKTGNVKGTRAYVAKQEKEIAKQSDVTVEYIQNKLDSDTRGMIWELIDRANKDGLALVRLNYQNYVGTALQTITVNEGKSKDELFDIFEEKIKAEQKKQQKEEGGTISSLFPIAGDDE